MSNTPSIQFRGRAAVESGNPLWVFSPQHGWVPGGELARVRAQMLLNEAEHATWIYGAESFK